MWWKKTHESGQLELPFGDIPNVPEKLMGKSREEIERLRAEQAKLQEDHLKDPLGR